MARRVLALATSFGLSLAAFTGGCSCDNVPRTTQAMRATPVSATDLYRSYEDGSSRWTGIRVRITFEGGQYRITPSSVQWHVGGDANPAIIFQDARVTDVTCNIEIEGHVVGCVPTGFGRCITISHCSVTIMAASKPKD